MEDTKGGVGTSWSYSSDLMVLLYRWGGGGGCPLGKSGQLLRAPNSHPVPPYCMADLAGGDNCGTSGREWGVDCKVHLWRQVLVGSGQQSETSCLQQLETEHCCAPPWHLYFIYISYKFMQELISCFPSLPFKCTSASTNPIDSFFTLQIHKLHYNFSLPLSQINVLINPPSFKHWRFSFCKERFSSNNRFSFSDFSPNNQL